MSSLYQNKRAATDKPSGNLALSIGGWLLGGLGVGAVVMYFLDPASGSDRRQSAMRLATQAASQAGQSLGRVKETVSSAASDTANDAMDRISQALPQQEQSSSLMPVAITAIGCSLLGAAVMYVLDPDSGRRRRGYLRDQATSGVRSATEAVTQKGRHLRNRAQGMYHDASKAVQSSRFANFATDSDTDHMTE
ncbi:MAG TPA: hypothetical protein VGG19_05600 [Tepidisphaeraceae bacterium]